jgi:signal transduction histidine kinase
MFAEPSRDQHRTPEQGTLSRLKAVGGHPASGPESSWTRGEVEALLRVSDAAALATRPNDLLELIAAEACGVTRAKSASILLAQPGSQFGLAASHGLSADYNQFLRGRFVSHGPTVSRVAAERLQPVVVDDITVDPEINHPDAREWKQFAMREGYQALMSVPLMAGSRSFGVLNLYRVEVGPWHSSEIELAVAFAQHAASAIESAKLIDSQRRQVEALEGLVRVLRDQTHEYANRLHAISGLMALNEHRAAEQFLAQLMTLHHDNYASVIERVHHPILAGLLVAQMSVARQRGVEVRLHRQTHVETLPPALGSAEAVTIVANLIQNAVEAASSMSAGRRRASVRIAQTPRNVKITVRDWGPGLSAVADDDVFARGTTSKDDHAGIGLALVSEAVASAHGTMRVQPMTQGTTFCVTLPFD